MKVRCKKCDAIVDAEVVKTYNEDGTVKQSFDWDQKCYHCGSTETIKTEEPYRLPRLERRGLR